MEVQPATIECAFARRSIVDPPGNERQQEPASDDEGGSDGEGADDDSMRNDKEEPISGDQLFGRTAAADDGVTVGGKAKKHRDEEPAVFVDPNTVPNCKKEWSVKWTQVLRAVVPSLTLFCAENLKKKCCATTWRGRCWTHCCGSC